jgi:hypothetical protein
MDKERIGFGEWLLRLDMLLNLAFGKRSSGFEGMLWERLYNAGKSPLEVFEAMVAERFEDQEEQGL